MGAGCVPVCEFSAGDAYGCPSPAALSAPFGKPLSSTVSWDMCPIPFTAHNILCIVWSEEIIILQHLLWAQPGSLGALCHRLGMAMGTAVLPAPLDSVARSGPFCSAQGLCSCFSLWHQGISWS